MIVFNRDQRMEKKRVRYDSTMSWVSLKFLKQMIMNIRQQCYILTS